MSQYSSSRKLPPEVYRRRRIAVLVILALVIALIWWGVSSLIGLFTGGSSSSNNALPDGANQSNVEIQSGDTCPPGTVFVEALIGNEAGESKLSFEAAETPYIWFSLTNTNSTDCTFSAGSAVQFFSITSGDQLIWTSKQCDRSTTEDAEVNLPAGETISSPPQPWDKVYSSDSGCGPEQEPVVTGGASYHLKVEVNGELSKNTQQFVLN